MHGLYAVFSMNNSFKGLHLEENQNGLYLVGTDGVQIRDSKIVSNGQGIRLQASDHVVVENNSIHSNTFNGVIFNNAEFGIIRNCTVKSSGARGVIVAGSNHINIIDNLISENDDGIWIKGSHNNTINDNNVSDNTMGIESLLNSKDNIIYHNNFIANTYQASDYDINSWDNGYPSGGNYWSDYTGIDNYSGPAQGEAGSDGIGDSPYADIAGGSNQDNYPLMEPYNP